MNGRILSTLVALVVCAFPAAAVAQTTTDGTTTDYQEPPTTTEAAPAPAPEPEAPADDSGVAPDSAQGTTPAPAPVAPAQAATGTAPSTLAYTGTEAWLLGVVGLLALAGGTVLMRSSRRRA